MNKIIEREFYVSDEYKDGLINELIYPYSRFKSTLLPNKIKIIIEVPEREVTIKESEVREVLKYSLLNKEAHESFVEYFFKEKW